MKTRVFIGLGASLALVLALLLWPSWVATGQPVVAPRVQDLRDVRLSTDLTPGLTLSQQTNSAGVRYWSNLTAAAAGPSGSGTSNTVAFWSNTNTLSSVANAEGILTNNGTGGVGYTTNITQAISIIDLTVNNNIYGKSYWFTNVSTLNGDAFIIIGGSPNALTNGISLTNAYGNATSKTPHGAALSETNRYTIFLMPGIYDLGSGSLTMSAEFIDVIGLSENSGQMSYDPSAGSFDYGDTVLRSSGTTVNVTAGSNQSLLIKNCCLVSTSSSSSAWCLGTTQTGFLNRFKIRNVVLQHDGTANPKRPVQVDKGIGGEWVDVRSFQVQTFGMSVSSSVTLSATMIRCKAGGSSYANQGASSTVNITGTLIDCEGDGNCFASGGTGNNTISGTLIRCRYVTVTSTAGGSFCAGASATTATISGFLIGCDMGSNAGASFGKSITGTLIGCYAQTTAFTNLTGTLTSCQFNGDLRERGGAHFESELVYSGIVSPSQITANQNDYNPTGLSTGAVLRVTTDASRNITGLQSDGRARFLSVQNVGANAVVLMDESASSQATNRFALTGNITLSADQGCVLQYDTTSSRWRIAGGTAGGSGTANSIPKWVNASTLGDSAMTDDGTAINLTGTHRLDLFDGLGNSPAMRFDAETTSGIWRGPSGGEMSLVTLGASTTWRTMTIGKNYVDIIPSSNITANAMLRMTGVWNKGAGAQAVEINLTDTGSGSTSDATIIQAAYEGPVNWKLMRTGRAGTLPGNNSTNDYAFAGGTLDVQTTTTGTVGTGEDNLITKSLDADTLEQNGDYLEFDVAGTFAANGNSKRLRVYFGATAVADSTSLAFNGLDWRVTGKIVRTGAATQKATSCITIGGTLLAALTTTIADYTTPAETLSGAVTFKCTGEATADNDVVQEISVLKWYPTHVLF